MGKTLFVAWLCSLSLFAAAWPGKGKLFRHAAVVCAHPEAARVGEEVLRKGGNAADAAFAVHFALAVVYPSAGNLGGGGFALHRTRTGEYDFVDFRESAPLMATHDMFLDDDDKPVPGKSTDTRAAAGTPGSVAGIFALQFKYGDKDPFELLGPAIRLAEEGFKITAQQAEEFNLYAKIFKERNPNNTYLQKKGGWREGDLLRQPDLAHTLKLIREHGTKGFYEGETAEKIVVEMNRGGGLISLGDLKAYRAYWRKPVSGTYRGYRVVSAPPPSSGGIALMQMLKLAEKVDIASLGLKSPEDIFYATEIERLVYADRAKFVGDPDFYHIPVDDLLSERYISERFALIRPYTANRSADILPGAFPVREKEYTTHFSVVDSAGNAVSLTTTINDHYGSKIFVTGAGFLLNNEMDDFSIKPGVANLYGLTGMEANAIRPRKRMLSSMTPTMVEKDGKLYLLLGTPGGSTIITTVFRLIVDVIDHKLDLNAAVELTRFHHQWLPDVIFHEKDALTPETETRLKAMGYELKPRGPIGRADCIRIRPDGMLEAAPDPRGDDAAAGW